MTTVPRDAANNGTKGLPLNLIISNKSEVHYTSSPGIFHFFESLGYGIPGYNNSVSSNTLTMDDRMNIGLNSLYLPYPKFFSIDCKDSQNPCLQFSFAHQIDADGVLDNQNGAVFVTAALARSTSGGVKVVENGYDLARDQIVSKATSSYSGEPIVDSANKSIAYKTTLVYNDTELLSNISASDLRDNVGTDRRVPVLLVEKLTAPFNEPTKSYPGYFSGAAITSPLSTVQVVLVTIIVSLLPLAFMS